MTDAFRTHRALRERCGPLFSAEAHAGLSNRVYRVEAGKGRFFLRLPLEEQVLRVDRAAEAHNLQRAADLGVAVPAVYCDPQSAVLVTREVPRISPSADELPRLLGAVLGRLHASGAVFRGDLLPDEVCRSQAARLARAADGADDWAPLAAALGRQEKLSGRGAGVVLVPSHGDPSPGNCLFGGDGVLLIDWEFSAMAPPAWDLAYAIVEHGFSKAQESRFLDSYRRSGAADECPDPVPLERMKATCDAVSAFWAFEQVAAGRDRDLFRAFALERRDRALRRFRDLA